MFLFPDMDDHSDYSRHRQHISTIETRASPTRTLLQGPGMYPGYCTIRNGGLPMQELSNLASKSNVVSITYLADVHYLFNFTQFNYIGHL